MAVQGMKNGERRRGAAGVAARAAAAGQCLGGRFTPARTAPGLAAAHQAGVAHAEVESATIDGR